MIYIIYTIKLENVKVDYFPYLACANLININWMIVPGLMRRSFVDSMLSPKVTLQGFYHQLRRPFDGGRNTLFFHHKNLRLGPTWSFGMDLM